MACEAERNRVTSLKGQIAVLNADLHKAVGAERGEILQKIAQLMAQLAVAQEALDACIKQHPSSAHMSVISGKATLHTQYGPGSSPCSFLVLVTEGHIVTLENSTQLHIPFANGSADVTLSAASPGSFDSASGKLTLPLNLSGNVHVFGLNPAVSALVVFTTEQASSPSNRYVLQGSRQQTSTTPASIKLVAAGSAQAQIVGTLEYGLELTATVTPTLSGS